MHRIEQLRTRGIGTFGIDVKASVEEAVREFLDKEVSALVVYDGPKLKGIFTKNDVVRCCAEHPDGIRGLTVGDYMHTDLVTAAADDDLDEVMKIMVEQGCRHVPVLEKGKVIGMVTALDIMVHLRKDLGDERDELLRYIRGSY